MDEPRPHFPPEREATRRASTLTLLERERALFLYRNALERGDNATVDRVLQLAEVDAELESMILASHVLDNAEEDSASGAWNVAAVREELTFHLADASASAHELPPLTLADVAAQMQSGSVQHSLSSSPGAEFAHLTEQLAQLPVPLPSQLDEESLGGLFQSLGLTPSAQFQNGFRETALFLRRHRERPSDT